MGKLFDLTRELAKDVGGVHNKRLDKFEDDIKELVLELISEEQGRLHANTYEVLRNKANEL